MTVETEVPVAVRHLDIESIIELRSRTLSCHVPVSISDHTIIIQVLELVLQRPAVCIILLLICKVCVWSITDHLSGQVSARSLGDGSCLYVIVIILSDIELSKLRILKCAIESYLHAPWARLHRNSGDREFQSLVADGSDVRHEPVSEIRAHRHLDGVEKVLCITQISVNASAQPVVEEAVVKTDIICGRGLPPDHRVIRLWGEHVHEVLITHVIHVRRVVRHDVSGQMDIIPYSVLLAGLADGKPEFQG